MLGNWLARPTASSLRPSSFGTGIVAGLFARNFMIAIRFQTNLRADHMTAAYFVSRKAGSDSAPGRGVHFSE